MRVTPTNSQTAAPVRKKAGSSSSGFRVSDQASAETAKAVAAPQTLAPLDTLISLQEDSEDPQARKQAVRRASDMLDILEGIRLDLLAGVLPASRLSSLLALVQNRRAKVHDPRLAHVLDEIELRARVELAKAGHIF